LACVLLALLFFFPIMKSGYLGMLPVTLPAIITDSTHERKSFLQWMKDFCGAFFQFNSLFRYVVACVAGWLVLYFADRKREMHKAVFFLFAILTAFVFSLTYLLMYRGQSYFVFSINILGQHRTIRKARTELSV
ncbi:MAG: hypothetical protein Q4D99_08735, partial [Bacillota bacterium]|nr:hypothetical protein [Bacillota bacterium]